MSLNSLTIGPKRSTDAEFIRLLSELVFGEYTRAAGPHTLRMSEDTRMLTLIARLGGRAVGFAIVGFESPSASLAAIAVEPKSRGLGVARRLLAAAEEEAVRRGAGLLTLATAEANLAALDLFLKAGYRMTGRLFRYYGRGQNAVGMRKRLKR
jgi:ribosomal protein S18 acetylase RimI-like enzyme